jgi:ABC-type nitrate/sulfonate/bicarbonate transport system substrate-binding protein
MSRARPWLALVALVALVAGATACGSSSSGDSGDVEKVTLLLDWTPNTNHSGIYIAEQKGWYDDAGLDVEIKAPGETSNTQLLGAGKADLAISVQEELTPARAQGIPVVSVAAIIQHNTSSLLSLEKAGIGGPADLAGKTYGGYGGQLEEALIEQLISCAGGDPDDFESVNVGEDDFRIGLTRGRYDYVWIFDAWDGIRLHDIDRLPTRSIHFVDHTDCIPDWYTPLIEASEKMIDRRPEVLRAFLAATARGYREAMKDPSAAVDALMEASPELDRDLVTRSAEYLSTRYAEDPAAWGHQDRTVWARFTTFLRRAGLIEGSFDVSAAYTDDFLPKASDS